MRGKVLLPRLDAEERACLRSVLGVLGCEPVEVEAAEQASALLREDSFGLMVLDTEARDWGAWARSAHQALRGRDGTALLLLVSSERPEGRLLADVLPGTLAYAARPLTRDALLRVLRPLAEDVQEPRDDSKELLTSEWRQELRHERRARAVAEGRLRELMRSERRLHALLEATTSVMWTVTLDGLAVERSASYESFTGRTFAEYRGHGYMRFIHPEDRERVMKEWVPALRRPSAYASEYRLLRHDGTWRQMLSRGVPVLSPDGRVEEWVGWLVDITEQRQRELALRESEEQFRTFFNLAAVGMAQVAPFTGRFLQVNAKLCELLGYSADELLRMSFMDLTHPEDRPLDYADMERVARGEEPPAIHSRRCIRKDGGIIWLDVTSASIRDESGRPARLLSVVQDVTARRQGELERRRLVSVVESTPDVIGIHDVDGRVLYVNEAGRKLLGLESLAEIQGTSMLDHIHPEDRRLIEREALVAVQRKGQWMGDFRLVSPKTGKTLSVFSQFFLVRDTESGRPIGLGSISRDITGRKRAEERLTFLSGASRLLAAGIDDEASLLQHVAELASSSVATCCMVGLTHPEGALHWLAVSHRDRGRSAHMRRVLEEADGAGWAVPLVGLGRDGHDVLWVDAQDVKASDSSHGGLLDALGASACLAVALKSRGHVLGVVAFTSEDPDRCFEEADRGMAEELAFRAAAAVDNARLYAQAQRAIRLRDEFLSIASHELKTPLTPLALKLQGMRRTLPVGTPDVTSERMRGDLDMAQRQVRRLAELVDGLLDVSRICAGRLQLTLESVDLAELVRELVARYEPQAQRAQARILVEAKAAVVGTWDRSRLEQVVSNLLSNALKYGAGRPVRVRVESRGEVARLMVRDEGIGIEPQSLHRIFQRFERAVSERHYGGLGLGLYITRQIVEAHCGTVLAESTPGQGATFTVTLPLAGPSESDPCGTGPDGSGSE
ncbi:PAS domain S-box protein [Pyxidicoccus parkwayensis]|uniref:histidine kinase n=1 Tax=Pyxidicoccus parkwayensis TaxID=2813578 RepID=A0ABX7P9K6_9BACT|nr:PAS domain S-box protein [Pyxidicoccus parkwaysis]QSQ27175.1 PAS domain S-box protein [Pyxidicoccus parkwaysis]